MKIKVLIILILSIIFIPLVSIAAAPPKFNLTITVDTQESDSVFHFSLQTGQTFDLQTQNLTATSSAIITGLGNYTLTQDVVAGLKVDSILCTSDNPSDAFIYQPNTVMFSAHFFENINCVFNNAQKKTPVLIVPGLMGTELENSNGLLWADLARMVTDVGDSFLDPLAFNSDLTQSDQTVSALNIIQSENVLGIKFDYSGGLINEFESQGYTEGTGSNDTLFTFPYDWRYGASGKYADGTTNADLLAKKIQDILTQTGAEKVDVVAHSLGGLIVKQYAMEHPADNHIGKAVFVGVPNTGAPFALKVLLQGDSFGIPFLSQDEMKKVAENLPVSYDLFPSQQYFDTKGSFVKVVSEDDFDKLNYSENNLSYADSENFLTAGHNLNLTALNNSENLHTPDFDNFDLRTAGIDLYSIDGCKTATISKITEVDKKNIFGVSSVDYKRPQFSPGDNTVPLESSTNLPIDDTNKFYLLQADHSKMLGQDGSKEEIVNLISGSNLNVNSKFITQDISRCNLKGKAISVFSPVNIFVTDQNGNQLGLASDGSVINEIPGADFQLIGGHKFLFLPTDGGQVYAINLTGTDTGTFTIEADDIQNSQTAKTEVFSNLAVTPALTGNININPSDNSTTLSVKQDANSSAQIILPNSTLKGANVDDDISPVSVATFSAGQINVNATDNENGSGIFGIHYNLDNSGFIFTSGDSLIETVSAQGQHVFDFF